MDELVLKAKKGDKEAFTELVLKIEDELYKIAFLRLKNEEDILDAIQETMISAYKSIYKLKQVCFFKTWITRILINKCNDIYKMKRKVVDINENMIISDESNSFSDEDLDFNCIIRCLTYDEQLLITLFYLESYSINDISEILKINTNTIKTRLSRARNKIKNYYKGEM